MENLLGKNKIEIYSARYTPVNGKEPTQLSTLQLYLLGQQTGKRKYSHDVTRTFLKKKKQVISTVAPVQDFWIIMQKLKIFFFMMFQRVLHPAHSRSLILTMRHSNPPMCPLSEGTGKCCSSLLSRHHGWPVYRHAKKPLNHYKKNPVCFLPLIVMCICSCTWP